MKRNFFRIKKNKTDKLMWAPPCVDSFGVDKLLNDK